LFPLPPIRIGVWNCNVTIVNDKHSCSFIEWFDTIKFLAPPMRFDWVALNLLVGRCNLFYDN
jgi:hypothetical protein